MCGDASRKDAGSVADVFKPGRLSFDALATVERRVCGFASSASRWSVPRDRGTEQPIGSAATREIKEILGGKLGATLVTDPRWKRDHAHRTEGGRMQSVNVFLNLSETRPKLEFNHHFYVFLQATGPPKANDRYGNLY
jgi:hypothetical protein